VYEECHAQCEHNEHLDGAQDDSYTCREPDAEVGEEPHNNGGGHREDPPGDGDAGTALQKAGYREAKETDRRCGSDDVIDQVAPRGQVAEARPQAA